MPANNVPVIRSVNTDAIYFTDASLTGAAIAKCAPLPSFSFSLQLNLSGIEAIMVDTPAIIGSVSDTEIMVLS